MNKFKIDLDLMGNQIINASNLIEEPPNDNTLYGRIRDDGIETGGWMKIPSPKQYTANIGDGALLYFPVIHNLNAIDVSIDVIDNYTGESVIVDSIRVNENRVDINFKKPPSANQYQVIIRGGSTYISNNSSIEIEPSIQMSTGISPRMLDSINGAVCLTGNPPQLTRIGNIVFFSYQGTNKSSNTATTISIAEIPIGFRPVANVAQAIQTPSVTMNIQQYTSGTNVFSDIPTININSTTLADNNQTGGDRFGNQRRWSMRSGTQLSSGASISISMFWMTNDPH